MPLKFRSHHGQVKELKGKFLFNCFVDVVDLMLKTSHLLCRKVSFSELRDYLSRYQVRGVFSLLIGKNYYYYYYTKLLFVRPLVACLGAFMGR